MADDDDVLEGGDEAPDGGDASPKSRAAAVGLIPKLLKFIALGVGALIFIVTVVVITYNIMNGGGKAAAAQIPQTDSYVAIKPIYATYDGIGNVATKTRDAAPYTIAVAPVLEYDVADNSTQTELIARKIQIQDFMRRYFNGKYAQELQPEDDSKIKNEIKELLNTTILDKARVRGVLFTSFDLYSME